MTDYKTHDPRGWGGDPARGAALGRPSIMGELSEGEALNIVRKQLDDGGYDENGTYFGIGDPLFWVASEDGEVDYVMRAKNISEARAQVKADYPNAEIAGDSYDVSLDNQTLQELLDGEVESCEAGPNVVAALNDEIRTAAKEFEAAVLRALESWVSSNTGWPRDGDYSFIDEIVCKLSSLGGGAGYLYYMEHEYAGVGTWDGRWDEVFINGEIIRELSSFVKSETRAEYQKLKTALMIRAEESVPEEES